MKRFLFVAFFLTSFLMSLTSALAQLPFDPNCPPDDPDCPWTRVTIIVTDPATGTQFTVLHDYRNCNGVLEIRYVSITATGNAQYMDDFSIYHYNISSQMELLDLLMLNQDMPGHLPIGQTVPPCPSTREFAKFYAASCGVWVKCTYDLAEPVNRKCEQGYDEPFPDYSEHGVPKVDVWKWQPCGTTCCKRTYSVCKDAGSITTTNPYGNIQIKNLVKQKITPCTQEPGGSAPKYAKPCEDGC